MQNKKIQNKPEIADSARASLEKMETWAGVAPRIFKGSIWCIAKAVILVSLL
jgi:hypothetical protein